MLAAGRSPLTATTTTTSTTSDGRLSSEMLQRSSAIVAPDRGLDTQFIWKDTYMSGSKRTSGTRKWPWTVGLIALFIVGASAYNYFDYQEVNLSCLNGTDAIDVSHGFVMGNTSCRLRGSAFAADVVGVQGRYYFECREGNYEITAETSRVMPFACSISGTRIGPIPEM